MNLRTTPRVQITRDAGPIGGNANTREVVDLIVDEGSLVTHPALLTAAEETRGDGFTVVRSAGTPLAREKLSRFFAGKPGETMSSAMKRLADACRCSILAATENPDSYWMSPLNVVAGVVTMGYYWVDVEEAVNSDVPLYFECAYSQDAATQAFKIDRVTPIVVEMRRTEFVARSAAEPPVESVEPAVVEPAPEAPAVEAPSAVEPAAAEVAPEPAVPVADTDPAPAAPPEPEMRATPPVAAPEVAPVQRSESLGELVERVAKSGVPFKLVYANGQATVVTEPAAVERSAPATAPEPAVPVVDLQVENARLTRELEVARRESARPVSEEISREAAPLYDPSSPVRPAGASPENEPLNRVLAACAAQTHRR